MEIVASDVQRLHLGVADLDALLVGAVSSAHSTFSPAFVVPLSVESGNSNQLIRTHAKTRVIRLLFEVSSM